MGCIYKGYCSDMTRTIFAKYIPDKIRPIYDLVLKNQKESINEMREGANIKIISKMVESDFKLHGYETIHALGHGVGMEVHELPFFSSKIDNLLKSNMVVTDEPGIYIPGDFGVRIEDTVAVYKGEAERLTKSERGYIVVDDNKS